MLLLSPKNNPDFLKKNLLTLLESVFDAHSLNKTLYSLSKGEDGHLIFRTFCQAYYRSEPSLKPDYEEIWLTEEAPSSVQQQLDLSGSFPVDMILKDAFGRLSLVCCLLTELPDQPLVIPQKFLEVCRQKSHQAFYYVVVTNAEKIIPEDNGPWPENFQALLLSDFLSLTSEILQAIKQNLAGHKVDSPVKKTPFPHQEKAIQAAEEHFKKHDRGQLIMPCGSGKTLTSIWIKEKLATPATLFLFPSLSLLSQTKKEWIAHRKKPLPYFSVCSENDTLEGEEEKTIHSIIEVRGAVSTRSETIQAFLQEHQQELVIFCTYQSLEALCEAAAAIGFQFDLAICDEAHKTAGYKLSRFNLVHQDDKIKIQKRLYMTATPRVLSPSQTSRMVAKADIYNMDDVELYGDEFYHMSLRQAIEQGILVDYNIVALGLNDPDLHQMIEKRKALRSGEKIEELAQNYGLDKFMTEYETSHVVSFHSTIRQARDFQQRHKKLFPQTSTFHVNGEMSLTQRIEIFNQFKVASKAILTNARCLTEGIDIPSVGAVYFCNKSRSKIDIVQAAGRALRRDETNDKQKGYIVVPILHETKERLEEQTDQGDYHDVVTIVQSFSDHDERLTAYITNIRNQSSPDEKQGYFQASLTNKDNIVHILSLEERLASRIFTLHILK